MWIRIITLLCLLVPIKPLNLSAQVKRDVTIAGYTNREYVYFDSVNALKRRELKHLDSAYDCFVSFTVDTSGRIVAFSITELPVCPLPSVVKCYIQKMFTSANGKWLPQLKDSRKMVSDELLWSVKMVKAEQTIEERMKIIKKLAEYYMEDGLHHKTINKFYAHLGKSKTISLAY